MKQLDEGVLNDEQTELVAAALATIEMVNTEYPDTTDDENQKGSDDRGHLP